MMNLAEYRRHFSYLPDFLPWAALVADGIVLNKDGSLQRSARFRGPDLDSSVPSELAAVAERLNSVFRRLGSRWAIFVEAQRSAASVYPDSRFPDAASALVDAERKADFEDADAHFESAYFLTFLFLPPEDLTAKGEGWLFEGGTGAAAHGHDHLEAFRDQCERFLNQFTGFMPECRWLDDAETLSYLHSTVSTNRHSVRVPETPMHLDVLLADRPLTGGLAPMLGEAYVRVLTITGFPTTTAPGILDDLNRLAFPYRWATRAILMDKVDAARLLGKVRRQWFAKRKSIGAILKEVMTNEASSLVDNDAANKAQDADLALQELGADLAGMAYVSATLIVWDRDRRIADEKLRAAEKVIQSRNFTCTVESLNAVDAWLGSLPGHVYANVRQPPLSTLNLAHMMPVSAVWAGPERDEHLAGPPLLFGKAEGSTPFRLSLHVGDVGHSLIIGPTGSGKSVLLAVMALQFRRYSSAQVFAFDFGASMRVACHGMGGDWYDLGNGNSDTGASVRLQPLARIDDVEERSWATDWIAGILTRDGIEVTPDVKALLWSALNSLATAPVAERSLTGLSVLLQSQALKQALAPYCLEGPHGRLLDADSESLGRNRVQVFETEGLLGTPAAPAVLSYLFHRIGDHLDGSPTLIIIDEGWLALDDPAFADQLKEWLKTLRKRNASVVFATQSLADIEGSAIAPILMESCPTRLFLPNPNALEPQISAIYQRFGLNNRQIQLIAHARPKQDYYLQSRQGHRLFELGLNAIAIALCAASSKTDQVHASRIIAEHGPGEFLAAWLRHRDLDWAADLIPQLNNMERMP
ncbi:conjugal transfer protein TrbE [Asticcacaulis endophyticus]|uniref:Conjugal transfer protein TrbE n=1 Tax=Asticcacaulis endophyticus TaxID=1395890 RepID=A0A918UTM3_9CAUL|nr:conjugal transfer protein TrbE [Asticcacaulis endophyticus]GGZ32280.1 conjugal transfer protein TrbE [Asticcacaulis endophyticus]